MLFANNSICEESASTLSPKYFELEINWEDISSENYIKHSLRRNGVYGYATENLIVLEDGSTHHPESLSDHWEAFNNSKKFKPKTLKYFRTA